MVRAPHSLEYRRGDDHVLLFEGPTSKLTVKRLFEGAYGIRYDFSAYPIPEDLDEASQLFIDPEYRAEPEDWIRENGENVFRARDGEVTFEITLANGLIEVFRNGQTVHGGRIGSADTVLPRYPLRVHGSSPGNVRGKFNFRLEHGDRFFGLGDKGGDPDRRDRRFLMHNRDALGYRGSFSDPLYKSIPFFIKWNPDSKIWSGLALLAPDVTAADFGVESPYFYSFSLENGPFRYALFTGDNYRDILNKYTRLTGRPAFPPAFTFGFLGSSMDYTDPDDASERVAAYIDAVEKHKVPCEGLYLSSGYCRAEDGRRYAFEWNKKKFPNPEVFIESIRSRGYHVAANIKPGILETHPRYGDYAEKGFLVPDSEGRPYKEYYWGADASFWNFKSRKAADAWKKLLGERLIDYGIDGIWNDNNELEIEDVTVPAHAQRSTFALRMCRIAWETLSEKNPNKRPWVITRSGGIGIQRYARTWSGDNTSDWESLRTNNLMGLSMGLSGLPYFGHDIGGFFGPHPDSELFLRWCQSAVFQPRFVVHSWNDDGLPTELWSYPDILEDLKSLVRQHYEFMPYTYSHAYLAHLTGTPIQRSLLLEFPGDKDLKSDDGNYLFGDAVLAVNSFESGKAIIPVRLPAGADWYDPDEGVLLSGGTVVQAPINPNRARYLVKAGSIVTRSPGADSLKTGWFPEVRFDIYPGPDPIFHTHFEDDGESRLSEGKWNTWSFSLIPAGADEWTGELVRSDENPWSPPSKGRSFILNAPPGFSMFPNLQNQGSPAAEKSGTTSLIFAVGEEPIRFVLKGNYRRAG